MSGNDPTRPAVVYVVENSPPSCLLCGEPLPRSRSDRRFCSKPHAMQFAKWRKRLPLLEKEVGELLREMAEYARYPQFVDARLSISNVSRMLSYYAQLADKRQEKATRVLSGDGQ